MSWWDSSSFSSFASQALKNAQKKIDKVLDIKDSEKADTEQESNEEDTGIFPSGNTDCEEEIVDPLSSSSIDISADKIQESVKNFFDGAIDSRIINSESTDSNRISDLPLSPSTASSLGGTDSDTNKLDSSLDAYTSDDTVVDKTSEEQSWSRVVRGENSTVTTESSNSQDDLTNQQEIEETGNAEDMQESEAKNGSSGSVSPSSSYVKCMIEEAMDDNASDTHSNGGEKSECSRSTGGHDSGDEISTTTSSDIEIISTPTPNGDGSKVVDLSPLRIALQKTANRGSLTHRRSDSQSTTSSRDGQCDQLSPGRETLDSMVDDASFSGERRLSQETDKSQRSELPPLSEERLDIQQQQKLQKKLAEMTEVLNARENKLVQLSKENHDLLESNSILRSQLQQVEEAREAELEDINKVTTEFTQRLSDSEKRVNQAIREKEAVKKQLQRAQEDLEKKIKDKSLQNLIKEKDQQIDELMQEGEKLSKQQLQVNTIIKKLRVKEKENESLITSQKKKLEDQKSELDHLRKVCESKDDLEKKQTEAIGQLNAAVQRQEREMSKLKSDHDDAQERVRGLQTALDNSYKEIADLHRSNAAQDSKAHEAALSAEMQVREELKIQLDHERKAFVQEKEALVMQIEDLRLTLSRMEKEHNRREDMLRQEISDLQRHLQEDEARNQDLTQSVTSATRPLLRQIENLQSTYAAQSQSWEKVEKNLSDRLVDAQAQLATAVEKERSATEAVMELRSKVTSLETQISCLKQDKTQLTAELDLLKTKLEVLEDAKNSDIAQLETAKQELTKGLAEIKKEKVFLETQLDMEKTKVDQEKKKFALAQDQILQLEREAQRPISRGSQSPLSISRTESISGEMPSMFTSFTQDDLERSFILSPNASKTSLYESMRLSGAASILENLQSQLKQREGEIVQLRNDIQQLERTRESMARELVNLTNQNEELQSQVEQLPQYKSKLEDVDSRYNALLQMYGEKVEEAEELRMDLQDVKEMYKAQVITTEFLYINL
ncbi:hypothetical protein FSP39_024833 [Pinctada imbricata]|uniref:TATA element modulatory factor 1 TATA binding domain-containing protein n=1 Tax=Pinctada imbricata TaxID=66713 RepID=A0AA88XXH4_PINIB|nr:hypothetical protein FSP39_024833 [Pinctada imbricata]